MKYEKPEIDKQVELEGRLEGYKLRGSGNQGPISVVEFD